MNTRIAMQQSLLATNLTKTVESSEGALTILDNVSLEVPEGSSVAIVGPSGSGKSTLLGILAGLDLPSSGEVIVHGENLSAMNEEERAAFRSKYVGFVFQSFHLLPSLTALENVSLPLELHNKPDAMEQARAYLSRVGLEERLRHYPRQLSGGEQQRVALARAFACKPRILFADEPTGNLDMVTGGKINDLLFSMNQEEGTTLVLVTHESQLAERCQYQLSLNAGKVVTGNAASPCSL